MTPNFGHPTFSCPRCASSFELKPTIANRKISCKCGEVFTAPPMPAEKPEADPYALVETWQNPDAKKKPQTVVKVPVAMPTPTSEPTTPDPFTPYPTRKRGKIAQEESPEEFSLFRDRVVPIFLLIAGVGLRIGQIPIDRSLAGASVGIAIALALCQMILTVGLMLAGVLVSAKLMGVNFGDIGSAILKLCAMAIFAWATGAFAMAIGHYDMPGIVVAINLIFLIYAIGFWTMFPLDIQETVMVTGICAILQLGAACVFFGQKL